MVNELVSAISAKLKREFGGECDVYSEELTEEAEAPYFFIAFSEAARTRSVGVRYSETAAFDIQYFPEESERNAEMLNIGDELFEVLEYVTLTGGEPTRGTKMSFKIEESVLHFFVNYDLFLKKELAADEMETVTAKVDVWGR